LPDDVLQVNKGETKVLSVSVIESHLDNLREAISGTGGKVQVVDVKQGTCIIKFSGPNAVGKGVAAAIKDTFKKDIKDVIVIGF
jgi:hypothetical protein